MSGTVREQIAALLIGDSAPMVRLRAMIERVGPSDLPVLIEGPTGSGKELVARALHIASGREGPFVPFNVCAIADTMFEDALFGHVRGAFTGALSDSQGYLMQAHRGTAFLDEIGGMGVTAQVKLLRALETKEFRPVGGRKDARSDFRVVAASNQSVSALCDARHFRDDLRHRLGKIVLALPPLSARVEDIPALVRAFVMGSSRPDTEVSADALSRLCSYPWPGNVRELKSVMESATVFMNGGRVVKEWDITPLLGMARESVKLRFDVRRTLQVLEEVNGDVGVAALVLGVNKTTVYRRLKQAGALGSHVA